MNVLPPEGAGSTEYHSNDCALDFLTVRHACPKGIYLTALPDDSTQWEGVLFARQGPYSPAILRFQIIFSEEYPRKPPIIVFTTDVFHPLVSPLTTYTFSNQDTETDTVSASDQHRLPPGAFSLRHGFPECFSKSSASRVESGSIMAETGLSPLTNEPSSVPIAFGGPEVAQGSPHIAVILYYLRAAFTVEEVLDSVSLESAANPAAWHAWRTFRSKSSAKANSVRSKSEAGLSPVEALKQQPGGARSPGEWNWNGVWEDRVRKSIQNSVSEQAMFKKPGLSEDSIQFIDVDGDTIGKNVPWTPKLNQTPTSHNSGSP
ncbi:hypothetical protein K461DRAFT_271165 [Myriangium duriaei CBS 260.36]|uniref:UBC core domain-containing protein n=1 Tax=Myriangium duriaei CBS 260.36 TaxID=1168546 RepID=A0A9P4IW38_9PEZI|nr:hypothetical protein K461DRAFT_271165 [Myriangium duriaei CBS 260.36]